METLTKKMELVVESRFHDLPPAVWLVIGTSLIYVLAKAGGGEEGLLREQAAERGQHAPLFLTGADMPCFSPAPPQVVTKCTGESAAAEGGESFIRTLVALMKADSLARSLGPMVSDAWDSLQAMAPPKGEWGVMDPFDDIYRVVYRLTMRTIGTAEIYRDPKPLDKTLRMFDAISDGSSPARIIFPWLPTWAHLRKTLAGG
ncbi:hypothetical protein B0T25DRAFT_577546 [Lasiosphaeria hispida]|uniref:Cytochrome P450 n=1 Tax=Lasiosphaeria hispida TaxID=260671 RepID=A0AAJ0HQF1_9PEZI|nr:hypothetical protein B0T25DRAFT_577546 [Lasiosphaeria hispida]